MKTKLTMISLAVLIALMAIGCSPSSTPSGGAGDEKDTTATNSPAQTGDDKTGNAQNAAALPEGVDPNGPMLTPPKDGPKVETGPDGGKTDEMKANMPNRTAPGGPGGGGRRGGGLSSLVAMQVVKDELKITDDQSKKIEASIQKARENQDRQAAQEQLNKDLQSTLTAAQYKRLQELNYQRMGVRALTRPEVVKELGLSDDQVKKINEAMEFRRPEGAGNEPGKQPTQEEIQKMMDDFRKQMEESQKKALAVLTPEQKTKWEKLQGKKFEFPQPQIGSGMGGPRGGGA